MGGLSTFPEANAIRVQIFELPRAENTSSSTVVPRYARNLVGARGLFYAFVYRLSALRLKLRLSVACTNENRFKKTFMAMGRLVCSQTKGMARTGNERDGCRVMPYFMRIKDVEAFKKSLEKEGDNAIKFRHEVVVYHGRVGQQERATIN